MSPEQKHLLARTCALATGLTLNEVLQIAAIGPRRYKVYTIPKRSGGLRTICHPSRELKALQYVFLKEILNDLPINNAATAYKSGSSIKLNASAHMSSRVIIKFDFENFFPSIRVMDWIAYIRERLPHWSTEDINFSSHVMFWGEGGYVPACLSIGAPTSPLISNAIMYRFDEMIARFSNRNGLTYTRYADDITISSQDFLDRGAVLSEIHAAMSAIKYPRLQLNQTKTRLVSKATSRRVTGLVLANNGSVSLGRDRKRLIRSMVHHVLQGRPDPTEATHLAGLLSFANDVEPKFLDSLVRKYGKSAIEALSNRSKSSV